MAGRGAKNTWVLVVSGLLVLLIAGAVVSQDPLAAPIEGVIRMAAILGYLTVFLATLSSNYMRELTRFFGRPFIKIHHVASITALIALALHAVAIAVRTGSLRVFVPVLSSVQAFFSLGGRPALWLLAIAALVAWARKRIGRRWKIIHWLTYVAFFLGTIHAQMIGRNFEHVAVRVVSAMMAVSVVVVFVLKRRTEALRQRQR